MTLFQSKTFPMALYLSLLQWIPLFLLLLPILLSLTILKPRNKGNNPPPGPPRLPIIGNLHQLGELPHRSLQKLSHKYGPIMLMHLGQVPTLIISSPEAAKEVLKVHDLDCCSRPPTLGARRLSYNFLDIAFAPYGQYWRDVRKLCIMELFSTKKVKSFTYVREQSVARFMDSLSREFPNPVNLSKRMFYYFEDIVCKMACGKRYEGKQFKEGTLGDCVGEAMGMLGSFPAVDFFPYFGWIVDVLTGLRARQDKCFRQFDEFYQKVIDDHLDPTRPTPEHEDVVDTLIRLSKDQPKGEGITSDHIKAILMNIFLGAIDTGSVTVIWAMTELVKNPRVMKKVQDEVRSCIKNQPLLKESDMENLHYLKLVIKETLRLHPPTVLLLPRETMNQCKIAGYDVYPNTRVQVNVWAIGRDPKTWKDPEEFHPERFAESTVDFKGQHFELLPFGGGRRICPGLAMGNAALELTLANLLYCFDWEFPSGMTKEDISTEEELRLTCPKKLPLYLVPRKYNWQG